MAGQALAPLSLAARRACTARGIKRWPGLPPEDAIGKAGSGCFPDLPETGYYQTLRVTERSPQKSVSKAAGAASGNLSCLPALVAVACREVPAWPVCLRRPVLDSMRRASGSDRIVNGNRSHYRKNFRGCGDFGDTHEASARSSQADGLGAAPPTLYRLVSRPTSDTAADKGGPHRLHGRYTGLLKYVPWPRAGYPESESRPAQSST